MFSKQNRSRRVELDPVCKSRKAEVLSDLSSSAAIYM